MDILFFMSALACMAGYASTEIDRTGKRLFALKLLLGAGLIILFERYLVTYGPPGLLAFVTLAVFLLIL